MHCRHTWQPAVEREQQIQALLRSHLAHHDPRRVLGDREQPDAPPSLTCGSCVGLEAAADVLRPQTLRLIHCRNVKYRKVDCLLYGRTYDLCHV